MAAKVVGMERAVMAVAADVYATAHARARARMAALERGARGRWPVGRKQRRPHSRDLFRLVDESDGHARVRLPLVNDAKDEQGTPYTFFIKSTQSGLGGGSAWVALVRRPLTDLVRKLVAETVAAPVGGERG